MKKLFILTALALTSCASQSEQPIPYCAPDSLTTEAYQLPVWNVDSTGRGRIGDPFRMIGKRTRDGKEPDRTGIIVNRTRGTAVGGDVFVRFSCTPETPQGKQPTQSPQPKSTGTAGWLIQIDPFHHEDKVRDYYGLPPTGKPAFSITPIPNPPAGTYAPYYGGPAIY